MKTVNRRTFIGAAAAASAGIAFRTDSILANSNNRSFSNVKPAILGGPRAQTGGFSGWPIYDNTEAKGLLDVLYSSQWGRLGGPVTPRFEEAHSKLYGSKHSLGVTSGTSALYTMLGALGIGPGDEVIIPVYTFIATYNVVVLHYALPVLVDIDPESLQIDPGKIEAAITKNTKAIMPVHIGGTPCNLDAIIAIGKKYNIPVIEDACQAHLAEWRGKKVGNWGLGGGFSFQASKNLNSGEGGAIITNDTDFHKGCFAFHHQGQSSATASVVAAGAGTRGTNLRITEFQSSILLSQMTRLEEQAKIRNENALYLSSMFREIPGLAPAKLYEGTTNGAYHLYMFNYDKEGFSGMSRDLFIKAMAAEGASPVLGYGQMDKDPYITGLTKSKYYQKIYGEKEMKRWLDRIDCPVNARVTDENALWFLQTQMLGTRTQMEQIAEAARKIQKYSNEIKNK
ncbi:MAG: DegT/DnrJ/EryC1/StrS family aminotransferase [Bacteroidales bacterium]|jgi:dTDP-4-amino-4,6-dideoxygalactose transaminase|nr:DegT/DnrJ/EryC1/StrS family aminotransferase [Bacteroidales bacterium]